MNIFLYLIPVVFFLFSCTSVYKPAAKMKNEQMESTNTKSFHSNHPVNTTFYQKTVKKNFRGISSVENTFYQQFCDDHFTTDDGKENCKNIIKKGRFFGQYLRLCSYTPGDDKKLRCLQAVMNKIFIDVVLNYCIGVAPDCFEGKEYNLIPDRDSKKVVIFNCTYQDVEFGVWNPPYDSWTEMSMSSGEMLLKTCTAEDCSNSPVRVYIRDGKDPFQDYYLSFEDYHIIVLDKTERRLKFYPNSDENVICR